MTIWGGASIRSGPVSFQRASANSKLTKVGEQLIPGSRFKRPIPQPPYCCTTHVSIEATCPQSCPFRNAGCYEQDGIVGAAARKLDDKARELGYSGDDVIAAECRVIDRQYPKGVPQDGYNNRGRDLRLHVGGDVSSARATRWLAAVIGRWLLRGGGTAWAYTHRWRTVPRTAWGPIRVFASVETVADARRAWVRGYSPAMTMVEFQSDRLWKPDARQRLRVLPCPAQTRDRTCVNCRICLDRELPGQVAIAFELHGARFRGVGRRLPVLRAAV